MNKNFSRYLVLSFLLLFTVILSGCSKTKTSDKIEIVLDGGGVSGNYNSSLSMTPTAANPNPYNTLETLVNEWNAKQEKYYIKLNKNSMNGNRDTIVGYLSTSTGPDIIYQTGTTIAEDIGNDYFVDMTDYLDKPNPYIEGNTKWKEIYDTQELEATRAPNGSFYSIGIDRNVAGLAFNKKIFTAAGVDFEINTYGDLVKALTKVQEYSDANNLGIIAYLSIDDWYNIIIEGCLYGPELDTIDTIRKNGIVDTEELARASSMGLYKIMDGNNIDKRFQCYLELINKIAEFYPANKDGYTVINEFINGKVAVISSLGKDIMRAEQSEARKTSFEMGVIGYPSVTASDIAKYTSYKNNEVEISDKGVKRGISGIGTGWWITNSAMKKGTVQACVDFLQFITAPQNNGRMVNDLGYALPLDMAANGSGVSALYASLVSEYQEDAAKNYYDWHVFNSWGIMGFNYWSKFTVELKNLYNGQDLLQTAKNLNTTFLGSVSTLIEDNTKSGAWDTKTW